MPIGDCSFHFAVIWPVGKPKAPSIFFAIIVDGGKDGNGEEAHKIIEETLVDLQKKYGLDKILFDYWLVTHWDDDHFAGALKYFQTIVDKKHLPQVFGPVDPFLSASEHGMPDDRKLDDGKPNAGDYRKV